jgi:hypothetical protein
VLDYHLTQERSKQYRVENLLSLLEDIFTGNSLHRNPQSAVLKSNERTASGAESKMKVGIQRSVVENISFFNLVEYSPSLGPLKGQLYAL